jgi:hypothetical protein
MYQQNFILGDDVCNLQNQKHQLEQFVFRFKNGNEKYHQIKDVAEEHVKRLLTEEETLLDLALKAVIEALRMNPDSYKIIYNSKYDDHNGSVFDSSSNIAAAISSSSPCISYTSTKTNQNYYYSEYHEGLLELAKEFLKLLLNQIVDNTMVAAVKEK